MKHAPQKTSVAFNPRNLMWKKITINDWLSQEGNDPEKPTTQ